MNRTTERVVGYLLSSVAPWVIGGLLVLWMFSRVGCQ